MADRGVDGVSLREIGRAAGERNTAAVQYHFGSKEELIAAVFQRRMSRIDAGRVRLLDDLERGGRLPDLHAVIGALVYPQVEFLLRNPEDGSTYLMFIAQVHRHSGRRVIDHARDAEAMGLLRLQPLVLRNLAHLPAALAEERFALSVCYIVQALAEHALSVRGAHSAGSRRDSVAFARTLVDTAVGLLTAPIVAVAPPEWSAAAAAAASNTNI